MTAALTLLYDGGCPLCLREVRFLERRDRYREAMGRIHAVAADGTVLRDVTVFRRAYELVGLGWLYAPTRWPLIGPLADAAYGIWARWRLVLTRRPSLEQLCDARTGRCRL